MNPPEAGDPRVGVSRAGSPPRSDRRRPLVLVLIVSAAGIGTAFCIAKGSMPFVWIAAIWTAALGAGAWLIRSQTVRVVLLNLAAALFAIGSFEAYLWLTEPTPETEPDELHYSTDYYADHPLLGYAPRKGISTEVIKRHRGDVVYRATYTIDGHGLRATPLAPQAETGVLFFGGSVTFGEGLDDHESMPYRVAERYRNAVRVYNFGFHGYGPHQMLAALQHGVVEAIVAVPVSAIVYQAIPAHLARAAGRAPWDRHGPWYRVDDEGRAQFAGQFHDRAGSAIRAALERSLTYRRTLGLERGTDAEDVALFAAIVAAARDESARLYPDAEFVVLLWGYADNPLFQRLSGALAGRGLTVHPISEMLPHYGTDPARYQIGAHDRHPNALGQDLIAEHIVERIIGPLPRARRGPDGG